MSVALLLVAEPQPQPQRQTQPAPAAEPSPSFSLDSQLPVDALAAASCAAGSLAAELMAADGALLASWQLPLALHCLRARAPPQPEQEAGGDGCEGKHLVLFWAVPAAVARSRLLGLLEPVINTVHRLLWLQSPVSGLYMVVAEVSSFAAAEQIRLMYSGAPFWAGGSDTAVVAHCAGVGLVPAGLALSDITYQLELGPELPACPRCVLRLDEPVQDVLLPQNRDRLPSRPDSISESPRTAASPSELVTSVSQGASGAAGQTRAAEAAPDVWQDVNCPVCQILQRYGPASAAAAATSSGRSSKRPACATCGEDGQSYVCLLCGFVGCGRQRHAHGLDHFRATGHPFAVELHTVRIWDYVHDKYVHHLPSSGELAAKGLTEDPDKVKQSHLRDEYVTLLSQQLESQRQYFSSKLARLDSEWQTQAEALMEEIQSSRQLASNLQAQVQHHEEEAASLASRVADAEDVLKSRLATLTATRQRRQQLSAAVAETRDKRAVAEREAAAEYAQLKQQVQALKDEITDLKRHIVQREQLAHCGEPTEGHVIITAGEENSSRRRSGGGGAAAHSGRRGRR